MNSEAVIRPAARQDIARHIAYIEQDSPAAALKFARTLNAEFQRLAKDPEIGNRRIFLKSVPARYRELRKWPVRGFKKYLILYFSKQERIEVLRILHSAMDIERVLREMKVV